MASSIEVKEGHADRNLLASKVRFVFELLQNADDNAYTHARKRKEAPYVAFHIYRDKIVQLCNEDGFTPDATVSIGGIGGIDSAQGYISEKRIKLKSTFTAARKVQIQSGHFSLHFECQNSDPALNIIRPIWQKKLNSALDEATRTTLLLRDDDTKQEQDKRRSMIRNQFEDIQDTILLFTHNLEEIMITFHDSQEDEKEITNKICYAIDRQDAIRVKVTKRTESMGNTTTDEIYYHIIKHVAKNLAKDENRKYSADEEASKVYAAGEVVLAFPTRLFGSPILRNQRIFASLPIKEMGFKFLIQADFVMQADGKDIMTTSDRNQDLADAIAEAFLQAVEQMCSKGLLIYYWLRFLPQKLDFPWDYYWRGVIDKIRQKLLYVPVLQAEPRTVARHLPPMFSNAVEPAKMTARHPTLQTIIESRQHTAATLDANGHPLFADIEPRVYLSQGYQSADLDLLREYGLRTISMDEVVRRVTRDLEKHKSRLRSITDDDWQARVAKLLQLLWEEDWSEERRQLRRLPLIPLSDGRWSPVASNDIYFPKVQGINLPLDLDQCMVLSPSAAAQADRRKLFESMGVKTASASVIRQAIQDRYQMANLTVSAENAARHLHFLYLTADPTESSGTYDKLQILSSNGRLFDPKITPIYMHDTENGTSLLDTTLLRSTPDASAPRLSVITMNDAYFKNPPSPPKQLMWSFKSWLQRMLHIRQHLPLVDDSAVELSEICRYIAKHQPEKFMGFLQASSKAEMSQFHDNESIIKQLGEIEVLTARDTEHDTQLRALKDTYLPLEGLQELCNRFLDKGSYFPFLRLEQFSSHHAHLKEWEALDGVLELGLVQEPDLFVSFLLTLLGCVFTSYPQGLAEDPTTVCCSLYSQLQLKVRKSSRKAASQNRIRTLIEAQTRQLIFIPEHSDILTAGWANPKNCIWEGPPDLELRSKYCLKSLYSTHYSNFQADELLLADFFLDTLQIEQYWTWQDLIDEIGAFKEYESMDLDRIHSIYKCLYDMKLAALQKDEIKKTFANQALIYGVTSDGVICWYKTAECLWSSTVQIGNRFEISQPYEDLKDFFVHELGVQTLTVRMVYNKLIAHNASRLPIDEIKKTLVQFSSLLEIEGDYDDDGIMDPEPVLANRVFPVRFPSGDVQLRDAQPREGQTLPFATSDRRLLAEDFADKVAFLDFNMKEMRSLEAFIEWAHLEDCYLSRAVQEATTANIASAHTVTSLNHHISAKAGALVRIAAHFNAPRALMGLDSLYALLRNSNILETDSITSELFLAQNGYLFKAEKSNAMLHIHLDDKLRQLNVYVPKDEDQRDVSIHSKLPRRLCEWLMTNPDMVIFERVPPDVIIVVQSILSARSSSVPAILDDNGILEIDLPECSNEAITAAEASDHPSPAAASTTSSLKLGDDSSPISEVPKNSLDAGVTTAPSPAVAALPHRTKWRRLFRRTQ